MERYYITGTSSGIGLSLARQLVQDAEVVGYSRRGATFQHANYSHHSIDLSQPESLTDFKFQLPENADRVILINNAGTLGEIGRAGDLSAEHFSKVISTNLTSLCILCNAFVRELKSKKYDGLILNISSGAASHAIPSWGAYCASKAAVDMFSEVLNEEFRESGNTNIKCYSIYPGVVDTAMQEHIRNVKDSDFSQKIRFVNYKNEGSLVAPDLVSARILRIFKGFEYPTETIINLKEQS